MEKKLLLQDNGKMQEAKEISMIDDSQKLKMILGNLSWKILTLLSKKEMYPMEIARQLGMHEQKVYYHIRKLAKAGAITIEREERKKGATAKYYKTVSPAFGIEFPNGYKPIQNFCTLSMDKQLQEF
jgi:DNA-binding transcriptional ArsR family regulator